MPVNDVTNLPPLRTIFEIDERQFQALKDSFIEIDRTLPDIDSNLRSAKDEMQALVDLSSRLRDNLNSIGSINIGRGASGSYGAGNINVQPAAAPSSFDEEEGLIEFSNQLREFYYGERDPGFFRSGFTRAALFGGGAGLLGLGSQLLPGSLTRAYGGDLINQLNPQINTGQVGEDIKAAFDYGADLISSSIADAFSDTLVGRTYNAFSELGSQGLPVFTGLGNLIRGGFGGFQSSNFGDNLAGGSGTRFQQILRGSGGRFGTGLAVGNLLAPLGHFLNISKEDIAYARENETSLFGASLRRAVPNALGYDSFHEGFGFDKGRLIPYLRGAYNLNSQGLGEDIPLHTIPGNLYRGIRDYLVPPAEGSTLPVNQLTTPDGQPIDLGSISGNSTTVSGRYGSFDYEPLIKILREELTSASKRGGGLVGKLGLGRANPSNIVDFQSFLTEFEKLPVSQAAKGIDQLSGREIFDLTAELIDPKDIGRGIGQATKFRYSLPKVREQIDEDNPLQEVIIDLEQTIKDFLKDSENYVKDSEVVGFFDEMAIKAGIAEATIKDLGKVSQTIGKGVAVGVGVAILEFEKLEQAAREILEKIAVMLVETFIVDPIGKGIGNIISANVGRVAGALFTGGRDVAGDPISNSLFTPGNFDGVAGGGLLMNKGMNYNEHGPEFLVSAGPTAKHLALLESINSGDYRGVNQGTTVNVVQKFESGLSRAEMSGFAQQIKNETISDWTRGADITSSPIRNKIQEVAQNAKF